MNLATGLVALMLMGADGPSGPSTPGLRYDVRIVEMPGVAWRGALHEALDPINHNGSVSVWTLPRQASSRLLNSARNTVQIPALTGVENTSAVVQVRHSRPYVSHLTRVADGPVGHAHAIAFQPTIDRIEDSVKVQIEGRRLDQGVLATVFLSDCQVDRMLSYEYKETIQGVNGPATLNGKAEVPEVSTATVEGEWLIPFDGVLIVGLGLHTRADKAGKAETVERLAVIEVKPTSIPQASARRLPEGLPPLPIAPSTLAAPAVAISDPVFEVKEITLPSPSSPFPAAGDAAPAPPSNLPMAAPPRRDLPTAINQNGEVVETEVPDDEPMADPDESSEPRATPQSRVKPQPEPAPNRPNATTALNNRPDHSEPFLNSDQELFAARASNAARKMVRIEPRINLEVHVSAEDILSSLGAMPNIAWPEIVDNLAPFTPVIERAIGAYAASGGREETPLRIFDMEFPIGKSVKSRVSVVVDHKSGKTKTDASARPAGLNLPKLMLNLKAPEKKDAEPEAKCPADSTSGDTGEEKDACCSESCDEPQASNDESPEPCAEKLTLQNAIRMGLENDRAVRVLKSGSASSPVVLGTPAGQTEAQARRAIQTKVLGIEQLYWSLASAQAQQRVSTELVSLARQVKEQHRDSWTGPEAVDADEAIERFELDRCNNLEHCKSLEMELRALLDISPSAPPIVAVSKPSTKKVAPDWNESLEKMYASNPELQAHTADGVVLTSHETGSRTSNGRSYAEELRHSLTHKLARYYLEVDVDYKLYETAKKLKNAAMSRLKEQDAQFQKGEVSPEKYLDALHRRASAIAQEADFLSRYNASLAALDELTGTLLDRDGVKFESGSASKTDDKAARTSFAPKGTRPSPQPSLGLVLRACWMGSLASPNVVRMPGSEEDFSDR